MFTICIKANKKQRGNLKIMKFGNLVLLLILVLCALLSPYALAQNNNKLVETISLSGIVKSDVGSSTTTTITLYQNGKKIRTVYPNAQGKYELELNFQSDYEIVFASEGNVSKKMLVNTETEGDDDEYDIPTLNFNIQLPKSTGGPIDEAYQTPVSKLFIDESMGNFNRDSKVEAAFKAELKKKTDEHKKWVEDQKKEEAEKRKLEEERKREEELARKKALEEARLAELEKARLEKEALEKKRLEEEAKKQAQKDALAAENERLRQQEEQRKLDEFERKKAEEAKRLRESEEAKLKQQQLEADRQAQMQKMRKDQEALARAQRQAEMGKELQRQAELEEFNRKRAEAEQARLAEEQKKARLAAQKAEENASALKAKDYYKQKALIDSLNQFHSRQQISKQEYLERQNRKIADLKPNKDLENTLKISKDKGVSSTSLITKNQEKAKEDYEKFLEEDAKRQTIVARQLKMQSEDATLGNKRTEDLDKNRQSKALTEIEERQAKREAYVQARKQKEEEKEKERAELLKEAMSRGNTPVLTPFVNSDGKFVGTVNYNDGRGNIPVTSEEYKQIQEKLKKP